MQATRHTPFSSQKPETFCVKKSGMIKFSPRIPAGEQHARHTQ